MAEETQIISSEDSEPVPEENISAETLMAAGDALSKSMLFTLRRDYLYGSVFEEGFVHYFLRPLRNNKILPFSSWNKSANPLMDHPRNISEQFRPRWQLVMIPAIG